ncbi:hypothetical protein U1Q18_027913 [Sarracenia purpurea var. burkii]
MTGAQGRDGDRSVGARWGHRDATSAALVRTGVVRREGCGFEVIPFIAATQRKIPGACNSCRYESGPMDESDASCNGCADPMMVRGGAHDSASR